MKHILALFVSVALILFAGVNLASAATLQLSTEKDAFAIGDQFTVDVKVDSEGSGINAVQGVVQISKDVLEIVGVDKSGSVFNFWLTEPTFSNDSGQVNFIGGSTSGFSGRSLQVVKVTFRVKGSGKTDIVFTDGAVTASDGSGTNVLSSMKGLSITSAPKSELETITPKPTQITRPAERAERVPAKPEIQVVGYRDPETWYSHVTRFSASWQLPNDITDVSTVISKDPTHIPVGSEGLFDNKIFPPMSEGVSYLHVRFRNNIGWGPTLHYRIAIDTTPPPAFQVRIREGEATDSPTPTMDYTAADGLSGLKRYFIQMNGGGQLTVEKGPYTFEPLKPGKYIVKVGAEDNAGNVVENILDLEIKPLEAPKITSLTSDVFVGEGRLDIIGTALPDITLQVQLKTKEGQIEQAIETHSDAHGSWATRFDRPLKKGDYVIEVTARDGRGALSYPVTSDVFRVRPRPALVLGKFEMTQFWFFTVLIIGLIGAFIAGWLFVKFEREQRSRKIVICQRDVTNMLAMLKKDIDRILEKYSDDKIDETEVSEIRHLAKRASENIEKSGKYCVQSIGEINK
ncbi:MAG: hypothetical protein UY31_C0068G0011 [Candidatus Wolfebacteria bacterium GW2011_GWE1_48_7]|nr:MAG: hypothetical protein UX70_C0001G0737 [Candidatus Wolfebacteria bacterium GW2011_GWB1_47_1]KKU36695.1 MAG: hypothetical protein UX49_C0011G0033 [Candidatus Wolfebacteria bacterium GW2011_GWC2_46_275]KKU42341.1 MAG: hypothetical protein UX58_C0002G0055 [Candidatus Wolfebacteria bacterium GW2011_GWB2_46_69]KKU54307.1 MAG: hypothetical protein UX76_C0003G0003 [Candidatus Wolfebacteria bacterium GW2011_GWC1_47_103]KKU58897.1 MAG: hypothetical protein UX83_C0010G0019 [Candidatus Wolfebacteria